MKGWVYVLSNQSMPELVKVGCTSKDPKGRAKELSNETGVPSPFIVEYSALTSDYKAIEKKVHQILREKRYNPNREFFSCSVEEAVIFIKTEIGERLISEEYEKLEREELERLIEQKEKEAALRKEQLKRSEYGRKRKKQLLWQRDRAAFACGLGLTPVIMGLSLEEGAYQGLGIGFTLFLVFGSVWRFFKWIPDNMLDADELIEKKQAERNEQIEWQGEVMTYVCIFFGLLMISITTLSWLGVLFLSIGRPWRFFNWVKLHDVK